ncbi:formate hydrogenlyase [Gordonibacter sp.]|uniref:formate hydrogenlyase n=1 Tax=Gordonibacter sp. TaxID=1968902 RepID=UPI002FC973EC
MKILSNIKSDPRKALAYAGAFLFSLVVVILCTPGLAFADGDPLAAVNNLSTFIFGLIRAIGLIILGFGVVQVGLSLKSHDPSQRANGFLTLAGGIVIVFAKEILDIIIG